MAQSYCSHKNVAQHCCIANGTEETLKERQRERESSKKSLLRYFVGISAYVNISIFR